MLRPLLAALLLCGLVASLDTQQALSGEASSVCQPCGAGKGTGQAACLPLSAPLVTQLLGDGLLAAAADGTVAQLAATACYLDHCTPTSAVDRDGFCTTALAAGEGRGSKRLGSSRRLLGADPQGAGGQEAGAQAGAQGGWGSTGSWWGVGGGSGSNSRAAPAPCAPPSVHYAAADGSLACCPHPSVVTYDSLGAAACGPSKSSQAPAAAARAAVPVSAPAGGQPKAGTEAHKSSQASSSGLTLHQADADAAPRDEFVAQQQAEVANNLRTRWQETMNQATSSSSQGGASSTAGSPTGQPSLLQEDTGFKLELELQPNTLQYAGGYVDLAGTVGRVIPQVATARICAELCQDDATCVAWKRKAGGASDTLECTLLTALVPTGVAPGLRAGAGLGAVPAAVPGAALGKYTAPAKLQARLPSVRYVNPLASAELVESGTKAPDALPSALYGCPYPPVKGAEGDCTPPPSCNCVAGICYGSC